jgi:hypothetical protein
MIRSRLPNLLALGGSLIIWLLLCPVLRADPASTTFTDPCAHLKEPTLVRQCYKDFIKKLETDFSVKLQTESSNLQSLNAQFRALKGGAAGGGTPPQGNLPAYYGPQALTVINDIPLQTEVHDLSFQTKI